MMKIWKKVFWKIWVFLSIVRRKTTLQSLAKKLL